MTAYYIEEFDRIGSEFQGVNYYKYTTGVSQGPYDDTSILMSLTKTTNSNGTLYYDISWLNQVYKNMGEYTPTSSLYYNDVYLPQIQKLSTLNPSDGLTFESAYNTIYNYISSQINIITGSESPVLYYNFTPPRYMSGSQPYWYLATSKTSGSVIQVSDDSSINCNFVNISFVIGNNNLPVINPIKKYFNWFSTKNFSVQGDINEIITELQTADQNLRPQISPNVDLSPIWPI